VCGAAGGAGGGAGVGWGGGWSGEPGMLLLILSSCPHRPENQTNQANDQLQGRSAGPVLPLLSAL
jgi:hypothetical protein